MAIFRGYRQTTVKKKDKKRKLDTAMQDKTKILYCMERVFSAGLKGNIENIQILLKTCLGHSFKAVCKVTEQ